jgi:gas vesicle protein
MARGKMGAVLGIVAGATLGILFAPKKGKELRKKIKKELDDGGNGVESVKKAFKDMGDGIFKSCKDCCESEEVETLVKKGKAKAKKTAKKAVKKGKAKLSEAEKKVKKKLKAKTKKKK